MQGAIPYAVYSATQVQTRYSQLFVYRTTLLKVRLGVAASPYTRALPDVGMWRLNLVDGHICLKSHFRVVHQDATRFWSEGIFTAAPRASLSSMPTCQICSMMHRMRPTSAHVAGRRRPRQSGNVKRVLQLGFPRAAAMLYTSI
jgi:hypothetical protein